MMVPTENNTRYEVKLVADEMHLAQVRSWLKLHPAGFFEGYPPRQINNVYFDTPQLDSFNENVAGISDRRKLRLRWYGSNLEQLNGTLELKCKRSFQGWKVSQRLNKPINLKHATWQSLRKSMDPEIKLELQDYFNRYSWPILMNRYQREYYLSFDRSVRVTLDFAIAAYDQRLSTYPNLNRAILPTGKMVIEVKAERNDQAFLSSALKNLPLRVGKHSKYALAMEAILV